MSWPFSEREIKRIAENAATMVISDMIKSGKFAETIDKAIYGILRETKASQPVTRIGFICMMAIEIYDEAKDMSWGDCKKIASDSFYRYLKDSSIKFGASGYDWTAGAARELAREYEINYWD